VCVDSRRVQPGALFVALSGEKTDGHAYLREAFAAGAAGVLVRQAEKERALCAAREFLSGAGGAAGVVVLAADNTLAALQRLAAAYTARFSGVTRIAITGSSGKSTTKEICAAIFAGEKKITYNEGNLNSETGLPLSVFSLRKEHQAGIFEMGMNRAGEIAELAAVLRPQYALITNIGNAHCGALGGGVQAVAAEKKAVFSAFSGSETAFIPKNCPYGDFLAEGVNGKITRYDTADTFSGEIRGDGIYGSVIRWNGVTARLGLPGRHNVENALAALALAQACGLRDETIAAGLESVKPLFGRSELVEGRYTILRDCYNANPDSMERCLDFCDSLPSGRRVYVLGSMLELGGEAEAAHRALGTRLAASKADRLFLFGEETESAYQMLREAGAGERAYQTNNIEELVVRVKNVVREGDFILLKGSRGCALERVEQAL
jgi:UDP-N-acetylmuramoyl-tripeptide--D-alanyl-D-alanine ligase